MITCIPESPFKWSFRTEGADAPTAGLSFDFARQEGGIVLGDTDYDVLSHGWLHRRWTLQDPSGRVVAEAERPALLSLRMRVEERGRTFFLTRAPYDGFEILLGDSVIGVIYRERLFTRRTVIDCGPWMSGRAQLFCFWLTLAAPLFRPRIGLFSFLEYHQTTVKPTSKQPHLS